MRRYIHSFRIIGLVLAVALLTGSISSVASAQHGEKGQQSQTETSESTETHVTETSSTSTETGSTSSGSGKTKGEQHKAAAQAKVCEKRQAKIKASMNRIADRGQKQLTLFGTIATRTEDFYISKGKTLSNYDQLVADVNTKHNAAQTALDAIKTASTNFTCDSADPKASVTGFKASLKSEISVLKDYRTAVKNLIVGVKSVQSTATTDTTEGGDQ
jgi:hypothetical protein